jgi:hypothetical protein
MVAVVDEATNPEWGGGGVWVPVVAIRINIFMPNNQPSRFRQGVRCVCR